MMWPRMFMKSLVFFAYFIISCQAIAPTLHIITGMETSISNHPWMLSIRNDSGFHGCGASLIRVYPNLTTSDIGLTAAHCFRMHLIRRRALRANILAGATFNTFDSSSGKTRRIIEVQSYGYFPADDAALVKFESPVQFDDRIKPIDLPPQGRNLDINSRCVVTGWGLGQHEPLQELAVTIQACNNNKFDYGNTFCAAGTAGSICSGDSGGPLVCQTADGRQLQEGIVSYSDPSCGDFPAVYARVSFYADWIITTARKMSSLSPPT